MNVLPLEEKRAWVVVAHENITERRKTEEELRVAMSKAQRHATELAAIMDAVPTAVFVAHDVECRQMSGNRVTQKLLGLPSFSNFSKSAPQEQRPTNFRAMKDGEEIPSDQLPVQMAAHGKEIRDYEFDLVFEDGTVHTILGDAVPLLDAEAHPHGAVGAFADITERKRIEGQFRRLIENSHDIIYTLTTEGVFIFVSPAWTVLLGYPVSEVIGQSFQEFVHPDDIPSCLQWLQKLIETGQRQADIDYRVCHMDGYWRWFTSSAVPLRDEAGRIIGCEGIAKDITERRRVEDAKEKLEFQNRQLQKSESLGRMAGAIAHHFNNQLQAVMMNLQLAMDDLPQNLRSVEDLTDAMQSAHKAAEVSTLMLTYLGQTAARREPLDLSEVCQHHLPMLRAAMPQSVSLESRLAAPGPVIDANANQIQQILTNLLTNAWEAADETWGAVHLTVKTIAVEDIPNINRYPIDCQPQGSAYACLKVADEGCGIADKDIEKVFDPFFSTKFTGRGLGLAVVLGIVRAHRGIITVQSRLGKGTVFRIFLPLSAKAIPKKPLQVAQGPKAAGGGTLLLVH